MFGKHISKQLSAYCHGELSERESRRVAEHLLSCAACRARYEDIRLAVRLAEHLPKASAPDGLWRDIETLLDESRQTPARASFFSPAWLRVAAASAGIFLVVALAAVAYYVYMSKASWKIEHIVYDPATGEAKVIKTDRLAVGGLIETDSASQIKIQVGAIGEVIVDPRSRVRLLEASLTEHRIALDRGRLKAHISAPPRIFFVDTPSAQAIDLGCEYTLEVDDAGSSLLHVTLGYVALEWKGREVVVPRYAMCESRPGQGAGTPYFETATARLRDALARFDFEQGGDAALAAVFEEADERDSFTLWNLLQRVDDAQRGRVFERMVRLVGLPRGVTREGIMKRDEKMLKLWADELDTTWF
jgi:ferric-dicitrate binding protein FerR (iron transport regulator)